MLNKKALVTYLSLTFGVTIILLVAARLFGFSLVGAPSMASQLVVAVAMFVPAISAIITQKFVAKKPLKELGFKFGPWQMYIKTYFLIVLVFVINYALTWLLITKPDFTLMSFTDQFKGLGIDMTLPMPAINMIGIFALITFLAAPIMNMIPSLGEEIGWRGFLLPNLEGLGQTKAVIISGMIWALWHTPMILILGFTYGAQAWPGVLLHFAVVAGIGIWMGYVWFKTRSTILAAFIHAVFNANAYGVWTMLFVSDNKLMVGAASLIGAVLCLGLGAGTLWVMQKENKKMKIS